MITIGAKISLRIQPPAKHYLTRAIIVSNNPSPFANVCRCGKVNPGRSEATSIHGCTNATSGTHPNPSPETLAKLAAPLESSAKPAAPMSQADRFSALLPEQPGDFNSFRLLFCCE